MKETRIVVSKSADIPAFLRKVRLQKKEQAQEKFGKNPWTVEQVSKRVGMAPQSLTNFEMGRRQLHLDTLASLCIVLNVKIELEG